MAGKAAFQAFERKLRRRTPELRGTAFIIPQEKAPRCGVTGCRSSGGCHFTEGLHIALVQKRNFRRGRRAGSHLPAGRRAASAPRKESPAAQGFSLAPRIPQGAFSCRYAAIHLESLLAIRSQGLRPLTIPERFFRQAVKFTNFLAKKADLLFCAFWNIINML